jgi:hypothetical protein
MSESSMKNYMHDVCVDMLETAFSIRKSLREETDTAKYDFELGRLMAYYENLSLIVEQAKMFKINLSDIGLENIDLEKELL